MCLIGFHFVSTQLVKGSALSRGLKFMFIICDQNFLSVRSISVHLGSLR
uniref:Uncharacterized protein n=1 Tax=Rhizophora mucronata TaxID=61149 RepID=A0A2P2PPS5_RHIMU